jgi:DNA-binding CsgD family transcriptional regulator
VIAPRLPDGERLLALLDAAYDLRKGDVEWLEQLARATLQALGTDCGVHAYFVDARPGVPASLQEPMLVGGPDRWQERWREDWWNPFMAAMDDATLRNLHSYGPCSFATDSWEAAQSRNPVLSEYLSMMASTRWGATHRRYLKAGQSAAGASPIFPDSFNLIGADGEGRSCALIANLPQARSSLLTARQVEFWERVAAHLGAGFRLRGKLRGARPASLDDAEGIFDAEFRPVHLQGEATRAAALAPLRDAAVSLDRARARRVEGREKLELWRALSAGRWSVQQEFDSDGRRFIVARPNSPAPPTQASLTTRESQVAVLVSLGHSNKVIAYELGVGASTVSTHVTALSQKLGAKSRIELIRLLRARGQS